MKKTGVFYHPSFSRRSYLTRGTRLEDFPGAIDHLLARDNVILYESPPIEEEWVLKVHTPELIRGVEADHLCSTAWHSVGGVVLAGEKVCTGEIDNAFALIGAGGHHSGRDYFGGYCCFNDVVITITSSFAPIILNGQIKPGTHIACMGTDTKGKQEVDAAIVANASVFTDEIAQAITIGECQHAIADGALKEADIAEIGAVINGTHPGRRNAEEITLFDGTGVGLQDLAVASAAVDLAVERGIAIEVEV